LEIPQFILDTMEPIRENTEAVTNFGVQHGIRMCKELIESGLAPSLHMYTLNREAQTRCESVMVVDAELQANPARRGNVARDEHPARAPVEVDRRDAASRASLGGALIH